MAIPPSEDPFLSQLITLEALDQDGAIREAAEAAGATRSDFLNASGALQDQQLKEFARITGAHENAHVKALKKVLGSKAIKSPRFDFGDTVTNESKFRQTAEVLEDTGVSAYAGQGPNIFQRPVVQAALSIHSVEARHAAWIRFINSNGGLERGFGGDPAPRAFDKALSEKAVLKAVTGTGFIQ